MVVKYINASLKFPVFSLSQTKVKVSGNDNDMMVLAGGGGSARSGVGNAIVIFRVTSELKLEEHLRYDTGEDLCTTIDVSSDSKYFATSLEGGCTVFEFDGKNGLQECGHVDTDVPIDDDTPPSQNVVRFNYKDARVIATGGDDGIIQLWKIVPVTHPSSGDKDKDSIEEKDNTDSKSEKKKAKKPNTIKFEKIISLTGHSKAIKDFDFDATGKYLASCAADSSCRIWNVETGKVVQLLPSDTRAGLTYRRCKFVSNKRLLTLQAKPGRGGHSYVVEFENVTTSEGKEPKFEVKRVEKVLLGMVTNMAIDKEAGFIALGDSSGGMTLVDLESLRVLKTFPEVHSLPVTGIALVPSKAEPEFPLTVTVSMDKTATFVRTVRPSGMALSTILLIVMILLLLIGLVVFVVK